MMNESTCKALADYTHRLFGDEDEILSAIRSGTIAKGLPQIEIQPEEGRMLQFLMAAVGAKRVVELGTLAGYSGVWMARALPDDGYLFSLEKEQEHADIAREYFSQAGLADKVDVIVGEAPDALELLAAEGPFDVVFIDADKPGYPAYLDWALENVRVGGLIAGHNAYLSGRIVDPDEQDDEMVQGILEFNARIASEPRLAGIIIPIGDGFAAGIKRG